MIRYGQINFEEAGAPGGGSPAVAAPVAAPTATLLSVEPVVVATPDPGSVTPPTPAAPSGGDWRSSLGELKDDPSLQTFQNVQDLAKSYVNARKAIGSDKITLPTKHGTPEEWRQIYHKLGLPQKIEEYQIEVPKDAAFQDGFVSELKKAAHEAGVLPQAFSAILNKYSEMNNQAITKYKEESAAETQEKIANLKQEWGQAFDSKLRYAQNVAKAFGKDPQVNSFLEDMGDDADFVKFLSMIGEKFFKEDSALSAGVDQTALSPDSAKQKLDEIYANMQHPYFLGPSHPGYESAKKEVTRLSEQLYGTKSIPMGQFVS